MKSLSVCMVAFAALSFAASAEPLSTQTLRVLTTGELAYVRWPFDAERDLVVQVTLPANENAYLVKRGSRTEDCTQGERVNSGGDDFAALWIGSFGHLSGNHGSYFGHLQTVRGHGFSDRDIGREVTHVESGAAFRLVSVFDENTLLIHPDGKEGVKSGFTYVQNGTFRAGERTWRPEKQTREQIYPMSRYHRRFWRDGKGRSVPPGREVTVDAAELVIEHDVIDPRALMRHLKENPGRRFVPDITIRPLPKRCYYSDDPEIGGKSGVFSRLDSLLSIRTVYRYVPRCACVVGRKTTVNAPVAGLSVLDVIHGWAGHLPAWRNTVFYAPRVKPVKLVGMKGAADVVVDLMRCEPLPWPCWKASGTIMKKDCIDPDNMPDRFIRIGGDPGRRMGVVLGCSLEYGMTALERRGADRPKAYFFWPTGKIYPYSFCVENVKAGTVFEHEAYKLYFDAEAEPDATSFYCLRGRDCDYVYLDFHKTLKGKLIRLPRSFAGRRFKVMEKTPSVTLHTQESVPADGIVLDVADGYGTLVLKVFPASP